MNELVHIGPISPLRQRLLDDMAMRRFGLETQRNYLRDVSRFATWLQRSPHTATTEDIRQFQFEQHEAGVPAPTMNSVVSALRFLFTHTLDRPDLARKLIRTKQVRKIPVVLTMAEVARLLDSTRCLKHQAALSVAYGAGLRVAEVAALKISDIDSKRMLLRIERGKGGRYRNAMLPEGLLLLLRDWWRAGRQQGILLPDGWLFPGQNARPRSAHASSTASSSKRLRRRLSPSGSDRTPCATASPPICWKAAPIYG
jgi:site-specific recombinase XerD